MIEVAGKQIYTELTELVAAEHTALVVVDMQRDFVDPDGAFGRLGVDLTMYPAMRRTLGALLAAARRRSVPVIHLQNTALPDRMSDSAAQIRFNLKMHAAARRDGLPLTYTLLGTPGHAFVPDLAPTEAELVVLKYRSSGFWGTNLELLLRSNGIDTVLLSGCTTEGCVESTARDALFNDHHVVVAEDCVASDDPAQHDASLLLMRRRFDVVPAAKIAAAWGTAWQPPNTDGRNLEMDGADR